MKLDDVVLRRLINSDDDYKLLEKWYQQEEIYSHFEQRKLNFKEIKEKYYPRTLEDAAVPVYMIYYNNNPVGIIQYKIIDEENKKLYKLNGNNNYEIDIFIGELDCHNKEIGAKAIKIIVKYLFFQKDANLLVMCPLLDNIKAIKCYQKCGFDIRSSFKTEDTIGDVHEYVLMALEKI